VFKCSKFGLRLEFGNSKFGGAECGVSVQCLKIAGAKTRSALLALLPPTCGEGGGRGNAEPTSAKLYRPGGINFSPSPCASNSPSTFAIAACWFAVAITMSELVRSSAATRTDWLVAVRPGAKNAAISVAATLFTGYTRTVGRPGSNSR
jgi:hypothetical protein